MWSNVETTFNANSTGPHRKGSDLEKKMGGHHIYTKRDLPGSSAYADIDWYET
ncbi:hypothetical protein DPMN_069868 [Dreissena polymorpha]|uniref:Uncharacterized protein n=1 Tax=Dreissena polymorpha TaxID=45954 RepID=A0A9D4BUQ6_DREPO|nr:hypothetical protein DPMN_069868 [Dreissena polymorpha]